MTLLTIDEAAKEIKMSEGHIRAAIRVKELRVVRFGKVRGVRIRPEDLRDYVEFKMGLQQREHDREMTALVKARTRLEVVR